MSDNWSDIGGGRYLVRTQAGFKQALNAWLSFQDTYRREVEFNEGSTFPEAFPSVVSFNWWHRGKYYVAVQHEHVNAFRQRMADMMRRLDDADPIDRDADLVSRVARAAWEELNRQHEVAGMGYASRNGETVLDGWYDLDAMARVVIDMVKSAETVTANDEDFEGRMPSDVIGKYFKPHAGMTIVAGKITSAMVDGVGVMMLTIVDDNAVEHELIPLTLGSLEP